MKFDHVEIVDNSKDVLKTLDDALSLAMTAVGMQAQGDIALMSPHDTGRLRNSITYVTRDDKGEPNQYDGEPAKREDYQPRGKAPKGVVVIGTNVEYAMYQELGTSKMDAANNGRGFIRPALEANFDTYQKLIKAVMEQADAK